MSSFGDVFKVSNYINTTRTESVDERESYAVSLSGYSPYEVELAKEWHRDSLKFIIYPTETLQELEELWMNFCIMNSKKRRESDDKSTELFGMKNQFHYELLKKEFLDQNFNILDDVSINEDTELNLSTNGSSFEGIEYSPVDTHEAIEWSKNSNIPIIRPCRNLEELEDLWNTWCSFPKYSRVKSDTKSIEIFGVNNITHYNYLKSIYLKENIPEENVSELLIGDSILIHKDYAFDESVSMCDKAKDLLSLVARNNESYENAIITDIINKSTDEFNRSHQNLKYDIIPFEDLPFFTPEEMIDAGVNQSNPENNFYGCDPIADIISEDMSNWFDQYSNACLGYHHNYDPIKWKSTIDKLYLKMSTAENKEPYKQAILNLGWPPEAEFSPKNRVIATKRLKAKLAEDIGTVQFVDLTNIDPGEITESTDECVLKPVFIILEEGKSNFSKAIKSVTKSLYSHAAISFDPKMETMYSYGIEGSENGKKGGFIKENIKEKDPDSHMAIFAIFLKENDWNKLKNIIDDFAKKVKDTSYSYANILLSHIFRIPIDLGKKMVCSQFVDKVLKLINVDISNKNSSLVSPADFMKFAKENKKIYILFDDIVKKFKASRINGLINRLTTKADPIKESIIWTDSVGIVFEMINNINSLSALQELSNKIELDKIDPRVKRIYESMIAPCLEAEVYTEAKKLPVQVDKDGNIFINKQKKNLEAEYRKSHQALKRYEETGSKAIKSIKYELFRLQGIADAINDFWYKNPSKKEKNKELLDIYARVCNDITYFTKLAMKYDPEFNFYKEYERSEFYSGSIMVPKNTVKASGKLLKFLLKSFT